MKATEHLAFALLRPSLAFSQANPWYQTDFPPDEFKARWSKIFEKIGNNAIAILQGVPQTNGFIMPRQGNDFYYLCGIETPHSYLLLDGRQKKATPFLPPRNARIESAEGKILSADDAGLVKQLPGVDEVASTDAMRGDFLRPQGAAGPQGGFRFTALDIYTPFSPAEGSAQSRGEIVASNHGHPERLLGRAAVARGALRRAAARPQPACPGRGPHADPRRDAQREEPARNCADPPCFANRGARHPGGDAQHQAGSL